MNCVDRTLGSQILEPLVPRERRAGVVAPYRLPVNGIPPPLRGTPFDKGGFGRLKAPVLLRKAPLLKGAGSGAAADWGILLLESLPPSKIPGRG